MTQVVSHLVSHLLNSKDLNDSTGHAKKDAIRRDRQSPFNVDTEDNNTENGVDVISANTMASQSDYGATAIATRTTVTRGKASCKNAHPDSITRMSLSGLSQPGDKLIDNFTPHKVVVLYNSEDDFNAGRVYLDQNLDKTGRNIEVMVGRLGQVDPAHFVGNLVVVINPSNMDGNPSHIEAMEHVHYSNLNTRNWVIALNPKLVSLTCAATNLEGTLLT